MQHWHDSVACSRLDLVEFGGIATCLSCGSVRPALKTRTPSKALVPAQDGLGGTEYSYTPIGKRAEIRTLSLLPGYFDEPLQIELRHERLGDLPVYDALSYTWADENGDATPNKIVHVGDQTLEVTTNCDMALRRLRSPFKSRTLWVDAICINQKDNAERGHQVDMMTHIYARARSVMVYLGDERDYSTELLQSLAQPDLIESSKHSAIDLHRAFRELISRRYFSRVWVIQEVALARRVEAVCGSLTVPWAVFEPKFLQSLLSSDRQNSTRSFLGAPLQLPAVLSSTISKSHGPEDLLHLLDAGRDCLATDPRDKIYGLLGLIAGGGPGIGFPVDYSQPVETLFLSFARYIIANFGLGHLLSRVASMGGQTALPSWVPDWSSTSGLSRSKLNISESADDWLRWRSLKGKENAGPNYLRLSGFQLSSLKDGPIGDVHLVGEPTGRETIWALCQPGDKLELAWKPRAGKHGSFTSAFGEGRSTPILSCRNWYLIAEPSHFLESVGDCWRFRGLYFCQTTVEIEFSLRKENRENRWHWWHAHSSYRHQPSGSPRVHPLGKFYLG